MKHFSAASTALFLMLGVVGCKGNTRDIAEMKPIMTRTAGTLSIVLEDATGDLKQGQNDFILQFRDPQGQPVDVGEVQLGSNMSMPGMAPMSGGAEITPAGQTGTYRVKANFGMSGAWHFTVSWNGPRGQSSTAFNSNVR